jgi:short-subunit dehydrogenase
MIEVNVMGFVAPADLAMRHLAERGSGHLVGLSSVASLRGGRPDATIYGASKAFVSNYMEALRLGADLSSLDIQVTEVRPGYVDTPMTRGQPGMFWVADVETAARQIHVAIKKRKRIAYITRRWRLVAWLLKALPYPIARGLVRAVKGK